MDNHHSKLLYFIKKSTVTDDDKKLISRYIQDEIILITYFKRKQDLDLESLSKLYELNFSTIVYFDREDQNIVNYILGNYIDMLQDISIDITNASALHSALLSGMSTRYDINVHYQTEDERKISLVQKPNYYDDATDCEIQILNQIDTSPKRTDQIINTPNGQISACRSNVYKLLEMMERRKIISRGIAPTPPDYKKKTPFGYKFTLEQKADFETYLRRKDKRDNDRKLIKSQKEDRVRMKKINKQLYSK